MGQLSGFDGTIAYEVKVFMHHLVIQQVFMNPQWGPCTENVKGLIFVNPGPHPIKAPVTELFGSSYAL